MNLQAVLHILNRYSALTKIVLAVIALSGALSLFFVGFFSRTPFSFVVILNDWASAALLLEASTKMIVAAFLGRVAAYLLYSVLRSTGLVRRLAQPFVLDAKGYRVFELRTLRYLRTKIYWVGIIFGSIFFFLFSFNGYYGLTALINLLVALFVVPVLTYPAFFRPVGLRFPPPFLGLPERPKGVGDERWLAYSMTSISLVVGAFMYFSGLAFFHSRASEFQTVHTKENAFSGSVIAASSSGILFLGRQPSSDSWRYSTREYLFIPFGEVVLISSEIPTSQEVILE